MIRSGQRWIKIDTPPASVAEIPVEAAARIGGDAWTLLVLREALLFGAERFESFQNALLLNSATLSNRLDQLVANALLERRATTPAYVPTERGVRYLAPLLTLAQWGQAWRAAPEPGKDLTLWHHPCGAELGGEVRCAACGGVLRGPDVMIRTTPAYLRRQAAHVRQRAPRLDHLERGGHCPIARTLAEIGDRWRALIIQQALFGIRRFDDFRNTLGIAPNILTSRLRELTAAGIFQTAVYQERPVRREYRLTTAGYDLYRVAIARWTWAEAEFGVTPGVTLRHKTCREHVRARQHCTRCDAELVAGDVYAERGSSVALDSGSGARA